MASRRLDVRDLPGGQYRGRRVFVRVDFNVPLGPEGIGDDTRLRASLPTIRYLTERSARVVLASHLGRPKGKVAPEFRMAPVARRLSELLGRPVATAVDCVGPEAETAAAALRDGEVLLLENLRFHAEEEAGDDKFARALASLADIYVNDAFGAAHRAHASTAVMAGHVKRAVAGLLMQAELEALGRLLDSPARPFVAILGGAKVSDKLGVIRNLLGLVDTLVFVAQPGAGDLLQYMKAGVLELPDVVVVNKSDLGAGAERTADELRAGLSLAERHEDWSPPVLCISARDGNGLAGLEEALARHRAWLAQAGRLALRRRRGRDAAVRDFLLREHGRVGLEAAGGLAAVDELLKQEPETPGFALAARLGEDIQAALRSRTGR